MDLGDPDDGYAAEVYEQLLELQKVDSRIQSIQHKLDHLDAQQALDDARESAAAVDEERAGHRVDLDRAETQQRRLEGEIDLLEQRKADEQAKMYSGDISNPRELQSLRGEIESTEKKIEEQESQLLEVMEVIDDLETKIMELSERKDDLDLRIDDLTDERDAAAKDLLAERAELEGERDQHRESLPGDLLEHYDEVSERHSGRGVAELEGGMCTGCRIRLPKVDQEDLLEGPPLGTCPQCGRLLVVP